MLTPQEVSEHAFSKASFGGYNMAMVDEFLDLLTADYTTLYKENAILKAKMKVLVDKVEEYRSTEDAMRKTLLTAQKMADTLLAEAEAEKAELLRRAETQAKARILELRQETEDERARLAAAQNATATYVEQAGLLCQREMDFLGGLSGVSAPAHQGDPVARAAVEIEQAIEQFVTAEDAPIQPHISQAQSAAPAYADEEDTVDLGKHAIAEAAAAPSGGLYAELMELNLTHSQGARLRPAQEPEDDNLAPRDESMDDSPTRRIDISKLNNLQFGREYEIK